MTSNNRKQCIDCNKSKSTKDFYKQKDHSNGVMSYCKSCYNIRCQKRWMQRKIEAIKYKGSGCSNCKLQLDEAHYSVFEFHHLDPEKKSFDWSKMRLQSKQTMKSELDKCILLCANCHRLKHAGLV